nr:MFS transporter [Parachlamydiaceae bacterium]
ALIWGIIIGCIAYAIAVVGIVFSSLTLLIIYSILSGISDSTASVAQAVVADISTEKNKARYFGYFNSSLGFGYTIGPFVGGKLACPEYSCWAGYSTPFIAAGIMMGINLLLVIWKFKETNKVKVHQEFKLFKQLQDLSRALKFKNLKWMFLGGFAFSSGWSFFNEFVPVLWLVRFDFSASDIGNFYGYSGLWYAFGAAFLVTPLLKFMTPERIVVLASPACAVVLSLLSLVQNPVFIWVLTPFIMIFLAVGFPVATTVVSNRTSEDCQGEVLGIFQAIQALAMGLIPLFFGGLVGLYPVASVWGAVFSMIVAGLAFWISPKMKKRLKV